MVSTRSFAILGLSLVGGMTLFGLLVIRAVNKGREFDRYLTVRGLSEREAKANLGIWPLRFTVSANDLSGLKQAMEKDRQLVTDYLISSGVKPEEIKQGIPTVTDRNDEKFTMNRPDLPRYRGVLTVVVRTTDVDKLKVTAQGVDALLTKGVTLAGSEWDSKADFSFDQVNEIKPEMIKEATAGARAAAEKFAQDSGSKVGRIRKATQGALEIVDRDAATPEWKKLRVVTTVEFFLE